MRVEGAVRLVAPLQMPLYTSSIKECTQYIVGGRTTSNRVLRTSFHSSKYQYNSLLRASMTAIPEHLLLRHGEQSACC